MSDKQCSAKIIYTTEKAEELFRILMPDDDPYVSTELSDKNIIFNISANTPLSLLAAADDVLSALKEAERVLENGGVR